MKLDAYFRVKTFENVHSGKYIFIWKNAKQNLKIRSSKKMAVIFPHFDHLGHKMLKQSDREENGKYPKLQNFFYFEEKNQSHGKYV